MTETVTYCRRQNCGDRNAKGEFVRSQTTDGRALCDDCVKRLDGFLSNIEKNYPRLYEHLRPGSVDQNPDKVSSSRVDAPIPVRVEIIDLADERHYLVGGSLPKVNVRGAVGRLQRWAFRVRDGRSFTTRPKKFTLKTELDVLNGSWDWILEQPWAADMFDDFRKLNRTLLDAVGKYGRKPVGKCPTILLRPDHDALSCSCACHEGEPGVYACSMPGGCQADFEQTHPDGDCNGPLLVLPREAAVFCPKCHTTRSEDQLRQLMLAPPKDTTDVDAALHPVSPTPPA